MSQAALFTQFTVTRTKQEHMDHFVPLCGFLLVFKIFHYIGYQLLCF